MNSSTALAAVAALLTLAGTVTAQVPRDADAAPARTESELQKAIREKTAELDELRAESIQPITVNGQRLAPEAIRRETIYLVKAKAVEGKIAEFFLAEQIEDAIANGRDPKDFEVDEAELVEALAGMTAQFRQQNPGVGFWDAVRAQYGLDKESFLHQQEQTELFNRVFFPGPAKDWPLITREAIIASAQGDSGKQFLDNLIKASVDADGNPVELPAFWMQLCRTWVQKQLKKWSDIRYPSDGLPADVCLRVNDRDWKTDEAFEEIRPAVFIQDLELAMTELAVREALKQELVRNDAYLSDEEFRQEFDEYRQEYDDTPFTTEVIATAFKGYPSLEAFSQRWRVMRSYERMIAKDFTDENLQAHANKFKAFFADGQTAVDLIQFLGRDPKTGGWVPGGVEKAGKRAAAAMKKIEGGTSFDDVMASDGEYLSTDKERGRLGAKPLNQIRQLMFENEFTDLLYGYSIASYLFYDAEVGEVVGPLRGPAGYYIARVSARIPARNEVSVQDERIRNLVKQDYASYRFLQWANEVVARAKIN